MRVLARGVNESVIVVIPPEEWIITVLEIDGDQIRLSVSSKSSFAIPLQNQMTGGHVQLSKEVSVHIVDVRADKVRIGVDAP